MEKYIISLVIKKSSFQRTFLQLFLRGSGYRINYYKFRFWRKVLELKVEFLYILYFFEGGSRPREARFVRIMIEYGFDEKFYQVE